MTGPMSNAKVSRMLLELLLLWLSFCNSVADKKKEKKEEWGEWGACAVTCGTGQRTRVGCTKKFKQGKNCPPGHVTTQTEVCSTASCSPSAYSSQAQSSPDDITSSIITSSVPTLLSSSASFSSLLILTSSSPRKTSSLGFASSARMMTSSSESVVVMPSTQFNQVSLKYTTTSAKSSRVIEEARSRISSLPLASSSSSILTVQSSPGVKTSNVMTSPIITSLSSSARHPSSMRILTPSAHKGTSSFVLESSAPMMTSRFASVVVTPSTQFHHNYQKSTTISSPPSSVTETSSSLALMSSSPKMTSSVESCSLHAMYSSPLPPSSALMMTSSSSSLIRISPSKSSQVTLKSTASSRSPSSRNDTDKDDSTSSQAYFNSAEENWILQNHVIKDIWTSSEITCAMMCLREKNCQSINFKSETKDSRQTKNANTRNCQLNSGKHLAHPRDFFPKKGYRYYYLI